MQEVEEAQDMSSAAKELIKLRDWVSLAQTGQHPITPEVLEEVYRELGRILAQEHVMSLEDIGPYDVNRQRVVDTRETDDLAQDDTVCHTVRPGYIFHGKLVRPQDVIVYAYKSSTVRAPSSESDGS